MTTFLVYSLTAALLAGLGVHGLITRRHLLRVIMALNVIAGGVFLLLISTAYRNQGDFADPVPQAMVLTGIVVAISATAFALALLRRIYQAQHKGLAREGGQSRDTNKEWSEDASSTKDGPIP
ncbi:sodium:proton antiporter [Desulfonatronum lacustre]|uniref:sodium:proton antiporter n=1 Tax=Desulfonatronum lacustre TaxID=66849 RepID=UPI0004B98906|nr:cation:proton antiporter subunit C [Desulfonatronum lacustre]